jgi:hypothetical protein
VADFGLAELCRQGVSLLKLPHFQAVGLRVAEGEQGGLYDLPKVPRTGPGQSPRLG